jgi:hypothetical protein
VIRFRAANPASFSLASNSPVTGRQTRRLREIDKCFMVADACNELAKQRNWWFQLTSDAWELLVKL